ncbi:hypothetical protein Tco_0695363 [Tanacetum coccineum]
MNMNEQSVHLTSESQIAFNSSAEDVYPHSELKVLDRSDYPQLHNGVALRSPARKSKFLLHRTAPFSWADINSIFVLANTIPKFVDAFGLEYSSCNMSRAPLQCFGSKINFNAARHNLLLLIQVNVVRHHLLLLMKVTAVRHNLLLPVQFCATAKAKTVNGEVQIQALVDGKKVIIIEASVRRDLQLADENGIECLPNATIFKEVERIGYEKLTQKHTFYKAFFAPQWKFLIHTILQFLSAKTTAWNEFSSTMASAVICLSTNKKFNFSKYIFDNMVKNLEGRVKFLMYPRFVQVFLDKQVEGMSKHKEIYVTPSHTKKVFANMKSGEDRLKLNEVMELCTNLSQRVLDLENTKTSQAEEITELKKRVKKLERRNKSRTLGLKRLRKVGRTARIESSEDKGLGDQEDASKQGRKIVDIDADEEVTLIDETQGRNDDNLMFDTGVLDEQEVEVEEVVSTAEVTTASDTTTTVDELTLAQTLIEIKAAKPKVVTTAATTTKTDVTRPKARRVAKDKGKAKMVKPEKPLKKKDQILIDEEIAQRLQEELQAKLEEEERLARQKEEDANIVEWENVQDMIDADYELAARLHVTSENFRI